MGTGSWRWLPWCFAAVVVGILYAMTATLPFFSEDYTHMSLAAAFASPADAFDPDLVPLRPLQHLFFYWLENCTDHATWLARLPGFAMHLGSCFLVYVLARQLGAGGFAALCAMALYVVFPNLKSLVWCGAIGWPGRQFFLLASLSLYLRFRSRPSPWIAGAAVLSFLLALGFHQATFLGPVFAGLFALMGQARQPGSWLRQATKTLLDPLLLGFLLLMLAYLCYLVLLRENRHSAVRSFDALPANVVRACLCLFPEGYRDPLVQGFRGQGMGRLAAACCFLPVPALVLGVLWKGSPGARCLLLAILLELGLAVLTTGFVQRYAYLASAFLALGLGLWLGRLAATSRRGISAVVLLLLGGSWAYDSWQDLEDYREAGLVTDRLLAQAMESRKGMAPGQVLVVVDLPECWGRENDIPVFNWGFGQALRRREGPPGAVAGGLRLWRTEIRHSNFTNSDIELVAAAELQRAIEDPKLTVLRYDPARQRLLPLSEDR